MPTLESIQYPNKKQIKRRKSDKSIEKDYLWLDLIYSKTSLTLAKTTFEGHFLPQIHPKY